MPRVYAYILRKTEACAEKLRDDTRKTKQKCMDEMAQADFRTDAKREERGGVLLGARAVGVVLLLVEETAMGEHSES